MKQIFIFLVQAFCIAASDYLFGLPGIAVISFLSCFIIILFKDDAYSVLSIAICTAVWSLTICLYSALGNGKMIVSKVAAAFGLPHYFLLILASTLYAVGLSASAGAIGAEISRMVLNKRRR